MKKNVKSWFRIFHLKKLIPPHPLTNFEIQKYYQNKPRFNGVCSRDNLPKWIKDGASLYVEEITYFGIFGVEHVPKEIKKFIGHKNIKTNIFRIQANNSIVCGCSRIGFIDFMFADKTLIDYTSLFSPFFFWKNDNIILSYYKHEWMQFYWRNQCIF